MDLSNPPFLPGRNKALDLLKWLAMLSMVLDHLRYVGWSVDFLYVPGRFAFPRFCLAIAVNLSRRSAAIVARGCNGVIWAGCWHLPGWRRFRIGCSWLTRRC